MVKQAKQRVILEIDLYSVLGLLLIGVSIMLFLKIYPLLLGLYIAFIIASILKPFLDWGLSLTGYKVNKKVVSVLLYLLLVVGLGIVVTKVATIFIGQFVALLQALTYPENLQRLVMQIKDSRFFSWLAPYVDVQMLASVLKDLLLKTVSINNTLKGAQSIFAAIPSILYILLASWYFLTDKETLLAYVLLPVRNKNLKKKIHKLVDTIETELGRWAAAQLMLMIIIGVLSFIALKILGINYALSLAIIAGLLEVVPNLGPLLALVPATMVALVSHGVGSAILVILAYLIIQQLENMFIVPHIMGEVVGLHPLIVLIAIALGQSVAGVAGALLAIPTLYIIKLILASDILLSSGSHFVQNKSLRTKK